MRWFGEWCDNDRKAKYIKKIFWDYEIQGKELQDILQGKILRAGHLDKEVIYSRMLSSLNWYVILDLAGTDHLDEVLSDAVVSRLHSKDLQKKYAIAKRILFS